MNSAQQTVKDLASESMLDLVAASNINPAVASSLFAETATTEAAANARILEVLKGC
jgi:hypothetical protein